MFSFIAKWRQSAGLRHSTLTILSYSGASAFSALAVMLISRLLGPTSFADFSVAFSLSLILNRLNDFGFSIAIQKLISAEWRQHKISAYLSLILKYRLALSVLLLLAGLLLSPWLTRLLHLDNHWLFPATFLFSTPVSYFELNQLMLQSLGKFKAAAYNYLLPSLLKFAMALVLYFSQLTDVTLILALYLLSCAPSFLIAEFLKPNYIKYQLFEHFPKEKIKLQNVIKHSAIAIIVAGLIDNLDIIFAKHYLTTYETGLLAGAGRIAMLLYVVAYALASVLNPRITAYRKKVDFDAYLKKAWLIALSAVIGFALSLAFTQPLIYWTIGPDYLAGQGLLAVLLGAGFLGIASAPFIATFYLFADNRYFSYAALLQLLIMLVGNLYFVPQFGLEASVYTRFAARLGLLLFTWLLLWKNYRREFGKN